MAVPLGCDDSGGFDCGAWHRAERSFDSASSTAELGTTPSGLQPGNTPSCSSATWHVALMSVPPDGCDDSSVFGRTELGTTPSGLRPRSTSSCSLATWHVALMPVPLDGCDDSDVFDCGARHHAERFLTGAAPHASPRRGMRHSCRCLSTAATTATSSTAGLGIMPSGFRPGQHPC